MDRGPWWVKVHGVQRVGDNWATSLSFFSFIWLQHYVLKCYALLTLILEGCHTHLSITQVPSSHSSSQRKLIPHSFPSSIESLEISRPLQCQKESETKWRLCRHHEVTLIYQFPQPHGGMPLDSAFEQVTELPSQGPGRAAVSPRGSHQFLWRLHAQGSDYSTHRPPIEVLPLPAVIRGEEPASAWTTPLSLERSSSSFPPQQLPFCISPLLNSFNLPSNHKEGWELGVFLNAVVEHQKLLTPTPIPKPNVLPFHAIFPRVWEQEGSEHFWIPHTQPNLFKILLNSLNNKGKLMTEAVIKLKWNLPSSHLTFVLILLRKFTTE